MIVGEKEGRGNALQAKPRSYAEVVEMIAGEMGARLQKALEAVKEVKGEALEPR